MRKLLIIACLVAVSAVAQQSGQPKYQQGAQQQSQSSANTQKRTTGTQQSAGRYSYSPQFTAAERDTIRTCMTGTYGNTGTRTRPLPSALDSQVQRNAKLPSGLQSRVQSLPQMCSSRLTMTLPAGWSRALLGNHVVLLDSNQNIADMFDLN